MYCVNTCAYVPVCWLVDAVLCVCTEQQSSTAGHGASRRHSVHKHTLTFNNACIHKYTITDTQIIMNVLTAVKIKTLHSGVTSDPSLLSALCFKGSLIISQPIKRSLSSRVCFPAMRYRWYELDSSYGEDCHACAFCFAKRKYDGVHERRTAQTQPSVSTFWERHMCKSSVINHIPSIPSPLEQAVKPSTDSHDVTRAKFCFSDTSMILLARVASAVFVSLFLNLTFTNERFDIIQHSVD